MAVHAPVVSFRTADVRGAGIEVQAQQDRVVPVGAGDALVEIDESVVVAHHDDFEIAAQLGAEALGEVEREVLFLLAGVAADRSAVFSAVAGVG